MATSKSKNKKIEKFVKKQSPLTLLLAIVFLLVGAAAGWFATSTVCKNDVCEVLGQKKIVLATGVGVHEYVDEGFHAVAFGQDISATAKVQSDLELIAGKYQINLAEPAEHYIKYTITHAKFGTVVKYRTIIVGGEE